MNNSESAFSIVEELTKVAQKSIFDSEYSTENLISNSLLLAQYAQYKDTDCSDSLQVAIERLYCDKSANDSFWNGNAGKLALYTYLYKKNILSANDFVFLRNGIESLKSSSLQMLTEGNLDFLYGAVGIAHSLRSNYSEKDRYYFDFFFKSVTDLIDTSVSRMIEAYDLKEKKIISGEVHIGIAHGILSILKLCIDCLRQGISVNQASEVASRIVSFLINNQIRSEKYTFANVVYVEPKVSGSRLAWCYGDLGSAVILHQYGVLSNNKIVIDLALDILKKASKLSLQDAQVTDLSVCHGRAGAAYIFTKMLTTIPHYDLKSTQSFWVNQTINDFRDKFKPFLMDDLTSSIKTDLLTGYTGIGLVLLSQLNNNFDWDYILMVND